MGVPPGPSGLMEEKEETEETARNLVHTSSNFSSATFKMADGTIVEYLNLLCLDNHETELRYGYELFFHSY